MAVFSILFIELTLFNNDYEGDPTSGSVKIPVRDDEVVVSDYDKANGIFTICKDDENNTVVILDKQNFAFSASPSKYIMAFNSSTTNKNYPVIYLNSLDLSNIAGKTVLCPIAVGDTQNYTPNAFYMPYAQNRSEGVLYIDGVKYYSNGMWCIKDE